MNPGLQTQYSELLAFLRDYRGCWQHEVLHDYPACLDSYPATWSACLDRLSDQELWLMDAKLDFSFIDDPEFKQCLLQLEKLTALPQAPIPASLVSEQARAFYGVRGKKRHEIEALAPVLQQLLRDGRFQHLVDVGGGQGHLARIMACHCGVPTTSLDRDPSLQDLGRKNLQRLTHRPYANPVAPLDFETCELSATGSVPKSFAPGAFILGLHTCGDLAFHLMQHGHQTQCAGFLSFGCCYSKMELDADGFASFGPRDLKLNNHALTLATRGHKNDSRSAFDFKVRVKRFRYSLHLFHWHERGIKRFIPMGESVPRVYRGQFSSYALERLQAHGINASAEELDAFFESPWVVRECRKLLYANLIRWQFGRALELLILLDRAKRMEDQGREVTLATYFDERISPRNIGVLARP